MRDPGRIFISSLEDSAMKSWKMLEKRLAQQLNSERNGNRGIATSDFDAMGLSFEVKQRSDWPVWFIKPAYLHSPDRVVRYSFTKPKKVLYAFDYSAFLSGELPTQIVDVFVPKQPKWLSNILGQAKANAKAQHVPVAIVHKKHAKRYIALCDGENWAVLKRKFEGGELYHPGEQEKEQGENVVL